ncbi:MAG: hypothetical protein PUP91_35635 [Rhizonema sp. PD37]|nr:hypothetical protein [Rhizonema sp. PD37]
MTSSNTNNTLSALLLTLENLETPLSDTALSDLSQVAEQLAANPEAGEVLIEPRLLEIIQANEALNEKFQEVKLGLDISSNIVERHSRIYVQDSPSDFKNALEISNTSINYQSSPNQLETTKQLTFIERLNKFLEQQISGK